MMAQQTSPTTTRTRLPGGVAVWSLVTGGVIVAGLFALLVRPLAPDLGPVPDPTRWFTSAQLARIAAYQDPVRWAGVLRTAIVVAVPVLVAVTASGRALVERIATAVGAHHVARAGAATAVAVVGLTAVARLPVDVWAHQHARRFGLSTQSLAGWAGDRAIEVGVTAIGAAAVVAAGYALAVRWPRRWVLLAVPLGVVAIGGTTLLAPLVLEPLRYDLTPLGAGAVRDELTDVLDADARGAAVLLVADASRRTTRQNAYVSGLGGTRRIVLFDTLLERPPAEVALIVAHELAHERNHDLARGVLAGGVGVAVLCVVVDAVARWRVARGRQRAIADPRAAGVVMAVLTVSLVLSSPVVAWASRRVEAAADLGSLQLTGAVADYCAVQHGLVVRNLSDPAPPQWVRLWWWSHPPAASRLELASRIDDDACRAALSHRLPGGSEVP